MKYTNAKEWRKAAMSRETLISDDEISQRRTLAVKHYAAENIQPDADTLADHELYILGKMDMQEYEQYLLFKHHPGSEQN